MLRFLNYYLFIISVNIIIVAIIITIIANITKMEASFNF